MSIDVRIVDTSEDSFGVTGLHSFAQGDTVKLKIDGVGQFPCEVVWVKGDRFGARIVEAFSEQDMLRLTEYLGE